MLRCCSAVWNPQTPKPNALLFFVNDHAFSSPGRFLLLSKNSWHTQSRNTVALKIASVSSHSSYVARFIEDNTHVYVYSSELCNIISAHSCGALISNPCLTYHSGRLAFALSGKKKYPLPVSILVCIAFLYRSIHSRSPLPILSIKSCEIHHPMLFPSGLCCKSSHTS